MKALVIVAGLAGAVGGAEAGPGKRLTVIEDRSMVAGRARVSNVIYLERCVGGCVVTRADTSDSRTYASSVPSGMGPGAQYHVSEFVGISQQAGSAADADWAALVTCVREVYSPYAVVVTDARPPATSSYHMAIVAGSPLDVGFPADTLGVAPLASDCSAIDNAISFAFASAHGGTTLGPRTNNLCWTVAQESAHAFGLDHEFEFLDGDSACNDPMTYRADCGGQKFFRNLPARCGTTAVAPACRCGPSQNSHATLRSVFGAGTSTTTPPHVELIFPTTTGDPLGFTIAATAGSQRGLAKVELLLNGYPWAAQKGAAFGAQGQPDGTQYSLEVPRAVPDGIVDVQVRVVEDIGTTALSNQVTLFKGAPCASAASCLEGQRCEEGRCFWDPPQGALGEACKYAQFCTSGICRKDATDDETCAQPCSAEDPVACPSDYTCGTQGPQAGYCEPTVTSGCCSASSSPVPYTPFALAGIGALVLLRRRRGGAKSHP